MNKLKLVLCLILCYQCKTDNKAQDKTEILHPNVLNVLFVICADLNDYQCVFGGHPQAKI